MIWQKCSENLNLRGVGEKAPKTVRLSDNKKTILGRSGNEISNSWLLAQFQEPRAFWEKIKET